EQYCATGGYNEPSETDRHRLLSGYYRQLIAAELPDAIGKMKQFACWFTFGVRNGGELRRKVHAARKTSEGIESVEGFLGGCCTAVVEGGVSHARDRVRG